MGTFLRMFVLSFDFSHKLRYKRAYIFDSLNAFLITNGFIDFEKKINDYFVILVKAC